MIRTLLLRNRIRTRPLRGRTLLGLLITRPLVLTRNRMRYEVGLEKFSGGQLIHSDNSSKRPSLNASNVLKRNPILTHRINVKKTCRVRLLLKSMFARLTSSEEGTS